MAISWSHMARTGWRQPVVGVLQAGPHGVAADLGRLEHVEDRAHGRRLQEGHVGVPPAGPVDLAVDGEHLGALVDGGQHGVRLGDGAELAGEVGLLLGRQRLVPEEDDVMRVQRVADGRHHLGRERGREVDAGDLGADGGGEGVDAEGGGEGHRRNSARAGRRRSIVASLPAYIGPPPTAGCRVKGADHER